MAITITSTVLNKMTNSQYWRLDLRDVVFPADKDPYPVENMVPNTVKIIGFDVLPSDYPDEVLRDAPQDYFTYTTETRTGRGIFLYSVDSQPDLPESQNLLGSSRLYYSADTLTYCDGKTIDFDSSSSHYTISL